MGVLTGCTPRPEVLKGDLHDAIFAADFGDVLSGSAAAVYQDALTFYSNTYPTTRLRQVVEAIYGRLANIEEPGATIRLSTGFGGGKTHTLIALWHLAKHIDDAAVGTKLLAVAGRPSQVTVAAVDGRKASNVVFARHGDLEVKSLWGEIVYQLGGESAWRKLGAADATESHPDEALLFSVFPSGPVLILLDELVEYMASLSEQGQGNMLSFLSKLSAIAAKRPQTMLVVTDPADQRVYAQQATAMGAALEKEMAAAIRLDDLLSRQSSDVDPIGDEAAKVIVTRLFTEIDDIAREKAAAVYHSLYERVLSDYPGSIPQRAASLDFAARIRDCYPFHPRLLETAQGRLASLQDFQKSRGVLRLFGRIIRDIWEAKTDLELITAGDLNWSSERIQADLLQRLNRQPFKAAVTADIEGHAVELDGGVPHGVHRRVASALLLESITLQGNDGMDAADLTLAVLRPDEAGPEPLEALDRLVGISWHTYPIPGGRGWHFRYEPNVNRLIEERAGAVSVEDAKDRVLSEVRGFFSQGALFKLTPWPSVAQHVPETSALQLALCESEQIAVDVCKYSDDSDPNAKIPRRFVNAVVAVAPTAAAFSSALDRAKRLLAAETIERENRTGDAGKLIREQLTRTLPELRKLFRIAAYLAFNVVVTAGGRVGKIEEVYKVDEEEILQRPNGQVGLTKFLEEKKLLYSPNEAIDTNYFLTRVLPGTVPTDQAGVYTAKAVHERFLGAPGMRLIRDEGVVRETVKKAVTEGKVIVRIADGTAYDKDGCIQGGPGSRRRGSGRIGTLKLEDNVFIALADAEDARVWLREDTEHAGTSDDDDIDIPPPTLDLVTRVTAFTWQDAIAHAMDRPLTLLELTATTPAEAAQLAAIAQPFSADSLSLLVRASGQLRTGGTANYQVSGVKPNSPIKPLETASTLFNALVDGSTYEATVALVFGQQGRIGMTEALEKAADAAPQQITVKATFEKPLEKVV